jgi:PAS domain S-box-containing protein
VLFHWALQPTDPRSSTPQGALMASRPRLGPRTQLVRQSRKNPMAETMPQEIRISQEQAEAPNGRNAAAPVAAMQSWYSDLIEMAGLGVWAFNEPGETTYVNRPLAEMLGYTVEEMMSLPVTTFCDRESLSAAWEFHQRRRRGISEVHEFNLLHRDGTAIRVYVSATPFFDRNKRFCGSVNMFMNVTAQKQAEEERDRSEARYRRILQSIEDGYYEMDLSGNMIFVNDALARLYGFSACDEMVGLNYRQFMEAETAARGLEVFLEVFRTRQPVSQFDYAMIDRAGRRRWVTASISPVIEDDERVTGFRGICRDVTERFESRNALAESENRFRAVFDNALEGLVIVDDEMNYLDANPAALRTFGMSREELLCKKASDFVKPERQAGFDRFVRELREKGRASGTFARDVKGSQVMIEFNAAANFLPGQHLTVMRDVTAREAATRALADSERRFRAVFDNALDAMVMVNDELRFVDANQAACQLYGVTKEEMFRLSLEDFVPPGFEQTAREGIEELKRNGVLRTRGPLRHPDGSLHISEFNVKADVLPGLHLSVNRDITETVRNTRLISAQVEVLEKIAAGKGLSEVMEAIARLVEDVGSELCCGILLANEGSESLRLVAAPSFPAGFRQALQTLPILDGMGSCGAAVKFGVPIVAEDIADSPYWMQLKDKLLSQGFKASWSSPIRPAAGDIAGTICILYRERHTPTNRERELVAATTHLASIAIDRARAEEKLRASEARFRALIEKSSEAIVLLDEQYRMMYVSPAYTRITGYSPEEALGTSAADRIHPEDRPGMVERLETLQASPGASDTAIYRMIHKDGRTIWLEATATNLREEQEVGAIVVNVRDVSKRKSAEDALRASENLFSLAFNSIPSTLSLVTCSERRILHVNETWLRESGFRREEVIGRKFADLNIWVKPEEENRFLQMLASGEPVRNLEATFRTRDGEERTELISADIIEVNGEKCILAAAMDITEMRSAEHALRKSEDRFTRVFNASPIPVSISTIEEGRFVNVNETWLETMGYTREDVIGYSSQEIGFIIPSVSREGLIERVRSEEGVRDWEFQARLKNGEQRTFLGAVEIIELEGQEYFLVASQDITQRKQIEEELRASQERFSKAFNSSPLPLSISTFGEGRYVDVNQAWLDAMGYEREEVIGRTGADLSLSGVRLERSEIIEKLKREGHIRDRDVLYRLRSGELRTFQLSIEIIRLDGTDYLLTAGKDITERKRAEDRLRRSEERYRSLFERNLGGVYRSSLSGSLFEGNQSLARIFGYDSFDEMRSLRTPMIYANPDDRLRMIEQLKSQGRLNNYELQMRRRDGTPIWTLSNITLAPADDEGGEMFLEGVLLDITDRKLAEEELMRHREQLRALSARIESVREEERKDIAREIHDQLGQLMTGLKLEFAWVEKRIVQGADEELCRRLTPKMTEIDDLLEFTIQTVRDIASKLRPGHLDDLGLIAAIEWEAKNFSKRTGVKIEFNLCREPQNLPPECSTGLFRIFQEILTNITRHAHASRVHIELAETAGELKLVVRDDGIGITPEKINHPKSLGLIGMHERALLLHGEVLIEATKPMGTIVSVRLPIGA